MPADPMGEGMKTELATRPPRPGWFYRIMMGFIGLFDRWLHLSCREFVQLASEKHERPLSSSEQRRHDIHRAMCKLCRVQEDRMDQLHVLVADLGEVPDDGAAGLSSEAKERILHAVVDASHDDVRG